MMEARQQSVERGGRVEGAKEKLDFNGELCGCHNLYLEVSWYLSVISFVFEANVRNTGGFGKAGERPLSSGVPYRSIWSTVHARGL